MLFQLKLNFVILTCTWSSLIRFFSGYILVCGACLMSAIGIVLTKKLTHKFQKNVIMFYLGCATVVSGGSGLLIAGTPSIPPLWEWGVAVGISVLGLLQQYCMIFAVQLESPSRVTVIRQFQIILAYVVQVLFFIFTSVADPDRSGSGLFGSPGFGSLIFKDPCNSNFLVKNIF